MAMPSGYVREINSIKDELKRINGRTKALKTQQKITEGYLYTYMVKHGLEEFEGIKLKKITPKPKALRKSNTQKKEEAIRLFYGIGVPDPEGLYEEFLATQKVKKEGNTQEEEI